MSKQDKSADALNRAMQDALNSVERIEQERIGPQPTVEVEAPPAPESPGDAAKLTALQGENEQLRDQLLRMAADFDNYRKRSRREQDDIRRFGIDRLLNDVLPIADNLDRALSHSEDKGDPVIEGVRMVGKQFNDVLASHGVKSFECAGQAFDPERHEAVSQEESSAYPPGHVLREMQRGYMIHDRLLRPARVLVSIAPSDKIKSKLS